MQEQSASNLKEFKEVMQSENILFCLFLGTALGAYRDKDFCEGDSDDIDVAVFIKDLERFGPVIEKMEQKGFKLFHSFINRDMVAPELCFKKDTKIDVFFLTPKDNQMIWRFYLNDSGDHPLNHKIDAKFFQTFDTLEFYGEIYNIPAPIEEYLTANYGNWQIKVPRSQWNWAKDNKCIQTK